MPSCRHVRHAHRLRAGRASARRTGETGGLALVDADSARVGRRRPPSGSILTPGVSADGRLLVTAERRRDRPALVPARRPPAGSPAALPPRRPTTLSSARTAAGSRSCSSPTSGVPDTLEVRDVRGRRVTRDHDRRQHDGVRFSPDGRLVAVGNNSGRAQVWSTADLEAGVALVAGHAGALSGAAISRDGRTLATGGDDGMVRLWDIRTRQAVGTPLPGVAGSRSCRPSRRTARTCSPPTRPATPTSGTSGRVAGRPGLPGRRPPPHARRVERVPSRARLRPGC